MDGILDFIKSYLLGSCYALKPLAEGNQASVHGAHTPYNTRAQSGPLALPAPFEPTQRKVMRLVWVT